MKRKQSHKKAVEPMGKTKKPGGNPVQKMIESKNVKAI